jgi:sugar/nucleoside kinase (ribokinase family)
MRFLFTFHKDRAFDVLGFGTNAVDYLITVPEFPEFGSKVELVASTRAAGGEVASTLVGLQRLGMRTIYAGCFGNDDEGNFGIRSLELEGVDISLSKRIAGAKTQIAFILIDEMSGERTVIWKRDQLLDYAPDDSLFDKLTSCKILHMTPHDTAACIVLAEKAREAGTVVSLDIDNVFDRIDELLPLVDLLICSSDFPEKLTGIKERTDALSEMGRKFGNRFIGMTLGDKGSLLVCNETFVETPGYDVPGGCRDTTGAGDAFRAGFLYGFLKEISVEESAKLANAVAALKCRGIGARTTLPDPNELDAFLKNP